MAIPSGSGSEVLTRGTFTITGTGDTKILDGVANHIYTVLSIIVCETAAGTESFNMFVDPSAGGTDYEILSDQALGANETFVWNDRLVITGTDELNITMASASSTDIYISYIDQDWS